MTVTLATTVLSLDPSTRVTGHSATIGTHTATVARPGRTTS